MRNLLYKTSGSNHLKLPSRFAQAPSGFAQAPLVFAQAPSVFAQAPSVRTGTFRVRLDRFDPCHEQKSADTFDDNFTMAASSDMLFGVLCSRGHLYSTAARLRCRSAVPGQQQSKRPRFSVAAVEGVFSTTPLLVPLS